MDKKTAAPVLHYVPGTVPGLLANAPCGTRRPWRKTADPALVTCRRCLNKMHPARGDGA